MTRRGKGDEERKEGMTRKGRRRVVGTQEGILSQNIL